MRARLLKACAAGLALATASQPAFAGDGKGGEVWRGVGVQLAETGESGSWGLVLEADGAGGYRVTYPELGCSGVLLPMQGVGRYREQIKAGDCIDGGTVLLERRENALSWFWTGEATDAPDIAAAAVLFREARAS